MTYLQKEPSSLKNSYKYIRRLDIDLDLRKKLGVLLVCFKHRGQVTNISKKYDVSRTFLYDIKHRAEVGLSAAFALQEASQSDRSVNRVAAWEEILKLRCIGKCSLSSISSLLSLQDDNLPNSTCFASQFLKELGGRLGKMVDWQGDVHQASDEIFMIGHQPILVTADPLSSAILRMEVLERLSKESWVYHWTSLADAGINCLGIVKDEGVAMNAALACESMTKVAEQTDTFHAISHRLGLYKIRLEKAVYKAMEYEWERERVMQNTNNEEVIARRKVLYDKACQETLIAIEQYESFQFLYFHMLLQLNVFDKKGKVRQQQTATEEVKVALEMMRELKIPGLEEQLDTIENLLPKLFNFLAKAQIVQYQLQTELGSVPTYFWTYAWQAQKKSRKIKNYAKSQAAAKKAKIALDLLEEHYQVSADEFEALKRKVFGQLDTIIQSSALVETINSILRPYMNEAKNQLSQEQLNIIRFYLNHRVYQRGKRKGYAPIELLRGEKLEQSWLDMLLELAK